MLCRPDPVRLSPGLRELTLSANPGISSKGWARLAIAVAHSSQLRVLNLDYNPLGTSTANTLLTLAGNVLVLVLIVPSVVLSVLSLNSLVLNVLVLSPGDQIAGMLAVAVASSRTLEVLDLEGTGLTNQSAQVDQSHSSISLPSSSFSSSFLCFSSSSSSIIIFLIFTCGTEGLWVRICSLLSVMEQFVQQEATLT